MVIYCMSCLGLFQWARWVTRVSEEHPVLNQSQPFSARWGPKKPPDCANAMAALVVLRNWRGRPKFLPAEKLPPHFLTRHRPETNFSPCQYPFSCFFTVSLSFLFNWANSLYTSGILGPTFWPRLVLRKSWFNWVDLIIYLAEDEILD